MDKLAPVVSPVPHTSPEKGGWHSSPIVNLTKK